MAKLWVIYCISTHVLCHLGVPIFLPIKPAGLGLGSTNLAGLVALNATVAAKKRATFVGFASCLLDLTWNVPFIVDFHIKNGDFPIKNGDFPLKMVIFLLEMGECAICVNCAEISSDIIYSLV